MIEWSIEAFRACEAVRAIVVAVPPGLDPELDGDDLGVVPGGATRSQSVANALEGVETDLVAIHDAARPLLTPELVEDTVAALEADPEAAGAIAATPVTDTVKEAARTDRGFVVERTVDRTRLWAAQTPQVFRLEALCAALAAATETRVATTDEAMLVEAVRGKVLIHPAPPENLKVTTPLDLRVAELLLAARREAGS
jgi:2-C-methyl-D-erythritol 4-phosphate cytidylyltransferase